MTVIHIINYTIPIAFMIFFGFLLDWMCRPSPAAQESKAAEQELAGESRIRE
ncbi:hypothetical protein [Bacillus sp. FJAT-27445]|uniref:hypothetical protein n=1 Tax=Bacillus sp. FJAT-27445 TaxID=1679166 RepID=UPI000A813AD2|nr:hypothetical protein [Bacillus sp. FJAT-27445]